MRRGRITEKKNVSDNSLVTAMILAEKQFTAIAADDTVPLRHTHRQH